MTQLAQALRAAGIEPSTERLHTIAVDALAANPRNWDGAKDAVYQGVRHDAALLWLLFEPYRAVAAQRLLSDVAAELRVAARGFGGGQLNSEHRSEVAPAGRESGGMARPALAQSAMEAVSNVARLSLLDTFRVNGRPIGDCTPQEANSWAASRERDARFVRLLTANLPDGLPIRKYRRAEETQALYDQAQEMIDVG